MLTMNGIIGNTALKERLCRDALSNSLSHAYIIEGASGSGRHTIALTAIAAFSCINKDNSSLIPCTECINCRKILGLKSPDVIFLGSNGKSTLGVDSARFLKEDVHILPNDLEHKFYIIEDADKMTVQAQNAILLTLEEPPSFVHFFILCNSSSSLLETIRSRAPVLRTEPVSDEELDRYISSKSIKAQQKKAASPKEYLELIKASGGCIGKALDLLESKSFESVMQLRSFVTKFINAATNKSNTAEMISILNSFSSKRDVLADQLSLLHTALRDLILQKKAECASLCFFADSDEAFEICDRVSLSFLFTLQNAVLSAIDECKRNANVKLIIMKMAISAELI